jgi:hypothetical protein
MAVAPHHLPSDAGGGKIIIRDHNFVTVSISANILSKSGEISLEQQHRLKTS